MSIYESKGHLFSQSVGSIIPQLVSTTATMRHVDELFQQLAYTIVQRLNVQLVQFWTYQVSCTGQPSVQLRTMAHQDASLPERCVVNDHIAKVAYQMISERHDSGLQPVEALFSTYQSSLLKRYGLNYCVSSFLGRPVFLPASSSALPQEYVPTLFAMTAWLFLRHDSHQDLPLLLALILKQTVIIAEKHNLLLPASTPTTSQLDTLATQTLEASPVVWKLQPRRKPNADLLLSSNPFAHSSVLADKKAQRLYAMIDGHANVADLCSVTGMEETEVIVALHTLLTQDSIEFYTPDGQRVDAVLLFHNQ